MKLLNAVDSKAGEKGTPYTPKEIDAHEYSERIWATIAECKREAQELSRKTWDEGYWAGYTTGGISSRVLIWDVIDGPYSREEFDEDILYELWYTRRPKRNASS
jgi:hypothetical protein